MTPSGSATSHLIMNSSPSLLTSLSALLPQLPLILVTFVGLVLSLANLQRLGRAGGFAAIGFGLLWANLLLGSYFTQQLLSGASGSGGRNEIASTMAVVSILRAGVSTVGYSLLLAAILIRRPGEAEEERPGF